jgi:prephenate dehydrogenase
MLRIAIIGMGLVGTSLGMALRNAKPTESALGPLEVVGYDSDPRNTGAARGRLAIDREQRSLAEAVRGAQLIVLAAPVQSIRELLPQIASQIAVGTIVTDVASTKAEVMRWARDTLPNGVGFVGGHPMAGKEQSGPAAADPDLFKDAIYCLTAAVNTDRAAVETVEAMVTTIGAKPYWIDPEEHDAYVAGISHLPFLLAASLVEVTSRSPAWKEMSALAASGYRDTTRLASGDPVMHRDIAITNRVALTRWINDMVANLIELREQLIDDDAHAIEAMLQHARATREEWIASQSRLRPGESDFNNVGQIERPNLFGFRGPRGKR